MNAADIDKSGGSEMIIAENFLEQIHSAGIKLVNGSHHNLVENNYLRTCGLTGIWVSVGVMGLGGSYENIVRNNILVGIGKGIGLNFWDTNFNGSTPAAIHLQAAKVESDRVRSNTIRGNRTYDNSEQRGVVVAEPAAAADPFAAAGNTINDNEAVAGPLPTHLPCKAFWTSQRVHSATRTNFEAHSAVSRVNFVS